MRQLLVARGDSKGANVAELCEAVRRGRAKFHIRKFMCDRIPSPFNYPAKLNPQGDSKAGLRVDLTILALDHGHGGGPRRGADSAQQVVAGVDFAILVPGCGHCDSRPRRTGSGMVESVDALRHGGDL